MKPADDRDERAEDIAAELTEKVMHQVEDLARAHQNYLKRTGQAAAPADPFSPLQSPPTLEALPMGPS